MEKLSSDMLEDDFVKMFEPIHWVQYLAGFHRVKIECKFVTATSVYYQLYSSVIWTVNILAAVDFVVNCKSDLDGLANVYTLKICEFFEVIINTMIALRNNFYDRNLNCQLYVKLQKVDRVLKVPVAANFNRRMFLNSAALTAVIMISWIITILVLNVVTMRKTCPSLFFVQFLTVASYMEVVLTIAILLFLAIRLTHVNLALEKEAKKQKHASISWAANGYNMENEEDKVKLVVAIHSILDSWADCIKLFQFPILSFTVQVLLCDFIVMLSIVTKIRDKNNNLEYMIASIVKFLLGMTSVFVLSFLANIITSKLCQTRSICFKILSMPAEIGEKLQKDAQQILMLLAATSTFSIYDIFTVDNKLPLRIFTITAAYTIVVLQFATI